MALKDGISATQDIFTLIKDVFIGTLVGALLLSPATLSDKFKKAGIQSANLGVFTWQAAPAAAQNISQAKQDVQDVTGALQTLAAQPKFANDQLLQQVLAKLNSSEQNITTVDTVLKNSLQQGTAEQPTSTAAKQGWIMLGRVQGSTSNKDAQPWHWATTNINVAVGSPYALEVGQEVQAAEALYLHADTGPTQHASGAVQGVVPQGSKVKLLHLDTQSHALAGGYFVWAQVAVES
jgi:hypothetical protein